MDKKTAFQTSSSLDAFYSANHFLGVAALILLVYAAVLLPVYGSIEEVLP